MSLSARRVWIEIMIQQAKKKINPVALRKESVDRNITALAVLLMYSVALRKESVDRNAYWYISSAFSCRRSPQGECG